MSQPLSSESPAVRDARTFFDRLNHDYVRVHEAKEELFWATYMALSDDHAGFARAEQDYKAFISEPAKLTATRRHLAAVAEAPDAAMQAPLRHGLEGWRAFFEAHVVEGAEAQGLMADLVDAEAALFARRQAFVLQHVNESGTPENATLAMLATNQATNPREEWRRSSHEAFRALEHWVLAHGYLEIVALRNRFARALGYRDYFDYKVRTNDGMPAADLLVILDDFLAATAAANHRGLASLRALHGAAATDPWNVRYYMSGDVVREMDPYVPFARGLRRWVDSFRRLGIQFRGATLQLDLLERTGKHQNGFCHGPTPAYFDGGRWVAGRINFTADATPSQIGSGWRALNTLFHEGGHAAHFANVTQNAPCFSQEYAPTSAAYAETQSMFCDSLLGDADWLTRYATNGAGESLPRELIRTRIARTQPFKAFEARMLAVVSHFEAAVYAMPDAARTPDAVLALARQTEARVLGIRSPRPLLAIPHLLNQESSGAYHGYLLAQMAVEQTRVHLLGRCGYLTDNPTVGPLLAEHYWAPGNSRDQNAMLASLTGEALSPRALAESCNASVDEAWAAAESTLALSAARIAGTGLDNDAATLDATIRVVHGAELIADNGASDEEMCTAFEAWVTAKYGAPAPQP